VRCREQHCERTTLRFAHDRCALASHGVHHRSDVVHPHLESGRSRDAVRHPHAAFVEEDQARKFRKPLAPPAVLRKLPGNLEVRVSALHVDEVDVPLADDAVCDVDVAAPREAHLRHARRFPRRCKSVN
jgi:hypothetical protein